MNKNYTLLSFCTAFFYACSLSAQCPITVNAGEDIYVCSPPMAVQLQGSIDGAYTGFTWSPTTNMTGSNTLTPTVTVTTTTSYVLTGTAGGGGGSNLIVNGDFESGNTGFTSDYEYVTGLVYDEDQYTVGVSPADVHPDWSPCVDHTSGDGNMMIVNGSYITNENVWCQDVPVTPNTMYEFSTWLATIFPVSPAVLQFSINGTLIGSIFTAPSALCTWAQFNATWNSGSATTATICIVNQNTAIFGNDFALDDIVFTPVSNCTETDTVTVHVVNLQAVAAPAVVSLPCGGGEVTLSGVGSSQGPGITYEWTTTTGNIVSGETTLTPVVNAAGVYTLTVTMDINGTQCTKMASVTVNEPPNTLIATIQPPAPLGCATGQVTLFGSSNQPAFSVYQWSTSDGNIVGGSGGPNVVVDQPGTYTLLVTNTATGCMASDEVTVVSQTDLPEAVAGGDAITCTTPQSLLSGAGSTTGPGIVYAWSTSNGTILSGQNSINAVAGSGGAYVLAVTNSLSGCTAYDTVTITASTQPPTLSIAAPGQLNCLVATLTLSATVSPTDAGLAWSATGGGNITGGGNTPAPTVDAAGTYTLLATDPANGCTATASVAVTRNNTPPTVSIQPPGQLTCQQTTLILTATAGPAGVLPEWSASGSGNITSGSNTLAPTVNAPGVYTLLVTDPANGCTTIATVQVTADADVVTAIAQSPDTLDCVTDSLQLNVNGSTAGPSITYSWTTVDGQIASGAQTATPTVTAAGTYTLLVTNTANGCTATATAQAVQNLAAPSVEIAPPPVITCTSPTVTLQGQLLSPPAGTAVSWTTIGGQIVSGGQTLQPVVGAPGLYTLTATNLTSGCTATASATVTVQTGTPVAVIAPPAALTCGNASVVLNAGASSTGPDYAFVWSPNVPNPGTLTPTVTAPGQYGLTVTNTTNGCTATSTVTVAQNIGAPPAQAGANGLLTCAQPVFDLSANAGLPDSGLVFQWQTTDGNFTGNPNQAQVGADQPGLYTLLVTDPFNGCTATDAVQVNANLAIPVLTIEPPAPLTCAQPTVQLQASAQGVQLSYVWETAGGQIVAGDSTAGPTVSAAGTYQVTVTDLQNGCTDTGQATVLQNAVFPLAEAGPAPLLTCAVTEVQLSGTVESGSGITVQWSTTAGNILSGASTPTPLVDAPGTYLLTVTNTATGCSSTSITEVLENIVPPQADAGPNDTLDCLAGSLMLQGSAAGGGSLELSWTSTSGGNIVSGENTATPTVNAAGQYILLVTDPANGCTASDAVEIGSDADAPLADAGAPGELTCTLTQVQLAGNVSSGPGFSFTWTTDDGNIVSGTTTLTPLVDAPGQYILTVLNLQNGCSAVSAVAVTENITPPAAEAGPDTQLTCTVSSIVLDAVATGPGGDLLFEWQTADGQITAGDATLQPTLDQPGTYVLIVTAAANGCTASDSVAVGIDTVPPLATIAVPDELTCTLTSVTLQADVSPPAAGVLWTSPDGNFVSGTDGLSPVVAAPGTYILTATDPQNGCTTMVSVVTVENVAPPVAQVEPGGTVTCLQDEVVLDGSSSSAGPGFAYAWTASGGGQVVSGGQTPTPTVAGAGAFELVVTDLSNGCTAAAAAEVTADTVPPLIAIALPPVLTCALKLATLDAGGSSSGPAFLSQWSTPDGHFAGDTGTLAPQVDQPGTYMLTIVNQENGCFTTTEATVLQNIAPPGAEAGPPAQLHCQDPVAQLQGSSAGNGVMFSWSTADGHFSGGTAAAIAVVDAPGQYVLTVSDPANGCTSVDSVTVAALPPPSFAATLDHPDCHQVTGSIEIHPLAGGEPPLVFSIDDGGAFSTTPFFDGLQPGAYTLVVEDVHGCTATKTVELDAPFLPEVELDDLLAVDFGDSVRLQPVVNLPWTGIAAWQWSPADRLSCADCPEPFARPLRTTAYTLMVTDQNGCTAEARMTLLVDRDRDLYAPNAISPNADGINDFFNLFGKGVADIAYLDIFDRWGNQVFHTEHLEINREDKGWDGLFREKPMNPAVFVWVAEVEFIDGEKITVSGDVTIVR